MVNKKAAYKIPRPDGLLLAVVMHACGMFGDISLSPGKTWENNHIACIQPFDYKALFTTCKGKPVYTEQALALPAMPGQRHPPPLREIILMGPVNADTTRNGQTFQVKFMQEC